MFIFLPLLCPKTDFMAIGSILHISDPVEDAARDKKKGTEDYDTLYWVRPLLDMMRNCYHPKQHISVNDRMVATKARRAKPTK